MSVALFERLTLVETMVHELPRGRFSEDVPSSIIYSRSPTALGIETDRFIREEMLEPSLAGARAVVYTDSDRSPVPALVREIFANSELLAEHSKEIARHLFSVQTAGASAGVFMASRATQARQPRIILMKAEHQEGVRLRHTGDGDDVVFSVEHLTELLIGRNTRVYKIAMFWIDGRDVLNGLMVDHQNGAAFAEYFLYEFLGCELTQPDEVQTEKFVAGLAKFIQSPQLDQAKRTRYATAAAAYLDSPQPRIDPNQFITGYIDAEDRDEATRTLPEAVRATTFRKDLRLVSAQIGALRMSSEDGEVSLSATPKALMDGTVNVEDNRVVINKSLRKLALTKKPRA